MKVNSILILFLTLMLFSCNTGNVEKLRNKILVSIKQKIEAEGGGIEIVSFILTHVDGNEYAGVLETMEDGDLYSYTVNVISDGKSFEWEIPPSEVSNYETDSQSNEIESNAENTEEKTDYYPEENHQNMSEAMENISDPSYCSLCKGTGIEENRARGTGLGDNEYGRICPMCNGRGTRSY